MRKFIVLTLYVCSSTVCAYTQPAGPAAAPSQAHYFSFGVFYDQDYTLEMLGLSNLNEDRNYTMGLGLFYSSDQLAKSPFFAPHKLLNRIFNHKEKFRTGATLTQQPSYAFMLADGAFTPDSLPAYYVIKNDRPYGSLTYIQTVISNPAFERYRNYTSTFSIGLLGIPVSREVQTYIHKKMNDNDTKNPRTPRGWGNQISNGGELTLAYRYAKEFLLTKKYINSLMPEKSVGAEFKHGYSYSVGYYTYFAYEMDMRLGLFDANNWTYTVSPLGGSDKSTGQIQKASSTVLSKRLQRCLRTNIARRIYCPLYVRQY